MGFVWMGAGIGRVHRLQMVRVALVAFAFTPAIIASSAAVAVPLAHPLRFFEGHTESVGTMRVVMSKSRQVRSSGDGTIGQDGSLTLVQQVRDEGQRPHKRIWRIRQVGPTKFSGTMTEATGPVTIEQVGGGYRFRFAMRGGLSVEEWLIPNADGNSGSSSLTVRKFGMTVAKSEGVIRKLPQQASSFP
jgi:hypothetical protein